MGIPAPQPPAGDGLATFVPTGIRIPVAPMLRVQGYRDPEAVRPAIRDAAAEVARRVEAVAVPEARYVGVGVMECDGRGLVLETGARFEGADFAKVLAGCQRIVATVVTLGTGVDEAAAEFGRDDRLLEALFLETAGWIAVESTTRALRGHLAGVASDQGLRLSRRLGPGYGDWRLDGQRDLFALFGGADIPVRLLDGCAMTPKMSRSGIYGFLSRPTSPEATP
jgi:hypothetical protein